MEYGEHCPTFSVSNRLRVFQNETVWLGVSWVDNQLVSFTYNPNIEHGIRQVCKIDNPPQGHAHGPFSVIRYTGEETDGVSFIVQGVNEQKQAPSNPWRFDWVVSVRNQNGTTTWAEPFAARCNQDQQDRKIVLYWNTQIVFVDNHHRIDNRFEEISRSDTLDEKNMLPAP